MARFAEADNRIFANVWVCMRCTHGNRGSEGKKPSTCRKCHSKRLRLKHKVKKSSKAAK
ncbi:hypothetical protein KKE06_03120 [Candidatus Micrarchaeota archaeon]|nr:hypothetical protein [Candidatus Micrarchaeota archaeon]MBU1930844.1 hypothetical protein [Candidatus Micrarchaeota archaeon]